MVAPTQQESISK